MTQPNFDSLKYKTVDELYKEYGLTEAKRIINEGKIESYKKLLNSKLITDADLATLAELCEERARLFDAHCTIGYVIRKKERISDED